MKNIIEKVCINCGKKYEVHKSRINSLYCSKICHYEYKKNNSGSVRKCVECGKEFYAKGNPKGRLLCSKKCRSEHKKTGKIVECSNCGKKIYKRIYNIKKSKNLFCCINCANEYQKCVMIKLNCKICGKEFFVYPSEISNTEKRGWKKLYCSNNCRVKDPENNIRLKMMNNAKKVERIKVFCKNCGKEIYRKNSIIKRNKNQYCSILCHQNSIEMKNQLIHMNNIQNKNKLPNKLEKTGKSLLDNLNINYEEQYLINGKICVDVYIKKYNLIIQWWGDYWHGHPTKIKNNIPDKRQKKRMILDISQEKYLKKCGYNLLCFWEYEVYKTPDLIITKIINIINTIESHI